MEKRTLKLKPEEREELTRRRDRDPRPYVRERATALLKIDAGECAYQVARHGLLKPRDPDTIYAWMDRYEERGLEGLVQRPRRKRSVPP